MKTARYHKDVEALLKEGGILFTEDFVKACPELAKPSVYSRIRALVEAGRLSRIGQGKYLPVHKPCYPYFISPWMQEVNLYLHNTCVGINHCISQKENNLFIEAAKSDLHTIEIALKAKYSKVAKEKEAKLLLPGLEGYIILKPLVSGAPMVHESDVHIPSVEKEMVDYLERNKKTPETVMPFFQKTLEVYPVNTSRLNRYAARRGLSEELSGCMDSLDNTRIELFSQVQRCLAGTAITKAWVFGSFARGEETPESDLDLLVDYDKDAQVSLLDLVRYKLDLEASIHREVDLIPNGSLKPFAVESANRDKYLIYER